MTPKVVKKLFCGSPEAVNLPKNPNYFFLFNTPGIRYAEFVVPLVKAVQEQQEMIDVQQATIEQQRNDFQNQLQVLLERIEALEKEQNQAISVLTKGKLSTALMCSSSTSLVYLSVNLVDLWPIACATTF